MKRIQWWQVVGIAVVIMILATNLTPTAFKCRELGGRLDWDFQCRKITVETIQLP